MKDSSNTPKQKGQKNFHVDEIIRRLGLKSFSRERDFLVKLIEPLDKEQFAASFKAITKYLMQTHLHHTARFDGLALYHVLLEKTTEPLMREVAVLIESKLDNPEEMYFASQLLSPKLIHFFRVEIKNKIFNYLLDQLKKGEIEKGLIKGGEPAKCLVQLKDILPDSIKKRIFPILRDGFCGNWWRAGFCVRFVIELADIFPQEQVQILLHGIVVSVIEKNSFRSRDELEFYIDKLPGSWYSMITKILKNMEKDLEMRAEATYWIDKITKGHYLDSSPDNPG